MAATKASVSAALRRAGFNSRRTGSGPNSPGADNPLVLHGGGERLGGISPVAVVAYSQLIGAIDGADPETVAWFAKKALKLAEECREALLAAGYACSEVEANDERARFEVVRG